jgi:hypothetical protein
LKSAWIMPWYASGSVRDDAYRPNYGCPCQSIRDNARVSVALGMCESSVPPAAWTRAVPSRSHSVNTHNHTLVVSRHTNLSASSHTFTFSLIRVLPCDRHSVTCTCYQSLQELAICVIRTQSRSCATLSQCGRLAREIKHTPLVAHTSCTCTYNAYYTSTRS